MAKILIVGASGFIGRALCEHLEDLGHQIIRGVRTPTSLNDVSIDYAQWANKPSNLPPIPSVDLVINAVGIIQETRTQHFSELHHHGPVHFFEACRKQGIKKFIQISALGANKASTAYWASKCAGDDFLTGFSDCEVLIVRPSLVVGLEGKSTLNFLKLAALPVWILPSTQGAKLRPVQIEDLTLAVSHWIEEHSSNDSFLQTPKEGSLEILELVGRDEVSLQELFQVYRRALEIRQKPVIFELPVWMSSVIARFGDFVHGFHFNRETYQMLLEGSTAPVDSTRKRLNREPKALSDFIKPALARYLRAWSVSEVMQWLFRLTLFFVFTMTAFVSWWVYPQNLSAQWLEAFGFNERWALGLLFFFSVLDFVLGVLSLLINRTWLWCTQLALISGYTLAISVRLPEFWKHPFGPVLKNFALFAILIFLVVSSTAKKNHE